MFALLAVLHTTVNSQSVVANTDLRGGPTEDTGLLFLFSQSDLSLLEKKASFFLFSLFSSFFMVSFCAFRGESLAQ